jgi:hypothetical protein
MRTRRIRTVPLKAALPKAAPPDAVPPGAAPLERLRIHGAGPDPGFRAGLRERLVAAAVDRGDDARNSGRKRSRTGPVD